jgi:hypothetical protein
MFSKSSLLNISVILNGVKVKKFPKFNSLSVLPIKVAIYQIYCFDLSKNAKSVACFIVYFFFVR